MVAFHGMACVLYAVHSAQHGIGESKPDLPRDRREDFRAVRFGWQYVWRMCSYSLHQSFLIWGRSWMYFKGSVDLDGKKLRLFL